MLYELFKTLGGADATVLSWFGFILALVYGLHLTSLLGGVAYSWCY